ncbi:MAG: hypothetical protein KBS68_07110 [Clostridiales bacterium]|nr:hypothetical protein [Candidatus Crickella merdequi]
MNRRKKSPKTPVLTSILLILVTIGLMYFKGPGSSAIDTDGEYYTETQVAAYLDEFGELPSNYVTKDEAVKLGWEGGNPMNSIGKCIGGDYYGNYEKKLPDGVYHECDVNYSGDSRGAERLVYSTTGDIYYTSDHYNSFEKLY